MRELTLKYGCNPHQAPASVSVPAGELPFRVLNGAPGYINLLDALNAWQLVRELRAATGLAAAASFKHVSPAGAALGFPLRDEERQMFFLPEETAEALSPTACAYARARGADRMSSFGDFAAVSEVCDESLARMLQSEVSDGIIAPGYTAEALALLKTKRKGNYTILAMDEGYVPPRIESRDVFGVTFTQPRDDAPINESCLDRVVTRQNALPEAARRDLLLALITTKYTQSNSVCYALGGQAIGIGAGQQSRVHCVRLAGDKADLWQLRHHDKVLSLPFLPGLRRPEMDNAIDVYLSSDPAPVLAEGAWQTRFTARPAPFTETEKRDFLQGIHGVSLSSDAFFPFDDSILRAAQSGVGYIAQPGGSVRDAEVIAACDRFNIAMAFTGLRLFHH